MAKLYYGSGYCNIEDDPNVRGVQISYKGVIEIEDKTPDSFALTRQGNGILIFPIGEGFLNELFTYSGELKIISVIVADNNGESVPTTIHRVMDYTELLTTKSEDMTTKSEDLKATYTHGGKVNKTILKQKHIANLHTSKHTGTLYLQDGSVYDGAYHIHLEDNSAMTGNTHTDESQDLYFKQGKRGKIIDKLVPTRNPSHAPPGNRLKRRRR